MKILFISDLLPEDEKPSIETTSVALCEMCLAWENQGAEVLIIKPWWIPKKGFSPTVKEVNYKNHKIYLVPVFRMPKTYTLTLVWFKAFLEKSGFEPDLVVTHMLHSIRIGQRLKESVFPKTKWVSGIHHGDVLTLNANPGLIKDAVQSSDAIWARSPWIREDLSDILKVDIESIGLCLSGLNPNDIKKAQEVYPKWESLYSRHRLSMVLAGNLIKQKGYDHVLKALAKYDQMEWFLHVFGSGPERNNLERLCRKLDIKGNVIFHGLQPRHRVIEFFTKSHLHLMPSVNETLGLAYLEAASSACANLALENAGIDGVFLRNKEAIFIEQPEASHILKALNRFTEAPEILQDVAIDGWKRSEELTWPKVAEEQLAFLSKKI